jgi:hypothetical protein
MYSKVRFHLWMVVWGAGIAGAQAPSWREVVEADWQRQDEGWLREIQEPGPVWFGPTQVSWGGVDPGDGVIVPLVAPPVLDGSLDDPTWQEAVPVAASAPEEPTYRIGHDGQRLYLAMTLPTQAESRFAGGPTAADAAGAVDGVKKGSYAFHTGWEPYPWWQVDLGKPQTIGKIVVYNRLDYAPGLHYADLLTILTSNDGQQWMLRYDNRGQHFDGVSGVGPLVVQFSGQEGEDREKKTTSEEGLRARFVRLQLASPNPIFFHLDEVEIYSAEHPEQNLALHRPAQQSSLSIWSKGGLLGSVLCGYGGRTVGFAGPGDAETGSELVIFPPSSPSSLSYGIQRHAGLTAVEVALPLHDDSGTFPGQITVAGGRVCPLRLAGNWQLVWPTEPPLGFGRNRLALDLRAPVPLSPPLVVTVETIVFTPHRLEQRTFGPQTVSQPGTITVELEVAQEGPAALILTARQGDLTWREARTFFIPPVQETLERGQRLMADFGSQMPDSESWKMRLAELQAKANALAERERAFGPEPAARAALYRATRWAVRDLAFQNPLLDFDQLLFVKRFTQQAYPDVCLNHMPWVSRPGGDLCILSPVRPDGTVYPLLNGALGPGHVHGMDLWWEGNRIVFGYARAKSGDPPAGWLDRTQSFDLRRSEEPIHLFEAELDPERKSIRSLRQITDGEWSDLDPTYLPNGHIAFVSERCGYSLQCNEYDKDETSCNLYVVQPDGSGLRRLSVTKDGDYLPHTLDNGLLAYTRWEYHERNWAHIQSIWTVRPDGTGADALFKQHLNDPWALEEVRSIPGSRKLVAIATGHHTLPAGPVVVVDPSMGINNAAGIRIVTPGVLPPEGGMAGIPIEEGGVRGRGGTYMHPWPLSEKYFLVSYAYGGMTDEKGYALYLIDVYGTRELIYRDPEISCFMPLPLRPRPRPPLVADARIPEQEDALCLVTNVHEGVEALPPGRIRYLRLAEPVGWPYDNRFGGQRFEPDVKAVMVNWNPVRVLGTVPVEADGSAFFRVPPDTAVYFQALDENQMELLRMRSFISFQPGEVRSCNGCHETRGQAPALPPSANGHSPPGVPLALRRAPSVPVPPPWGAERPVSFLRDIQPVFDRHGGGCHGGLKPAGGLDFSGGLTERYNRAYDTLQAAGLVSRSNIGDDARITLPLEFGSHRSKLLQVLQGSHRDRVKLSEEDRLRLVTWIDANAPYHGGFINKRPERPPYDFVADRPLLDRIRTIHSRRCASCHSPAEVSRSDWIDLYNPEASRFLRAPLGPAGGSQVHCRKAVYADPSDPDYQAVRALVQEAVGRAWESPRRDVATLDRPRGLQPGKF